MKTSEERSHVMYSLTSEACKTTTTNKLYSKKMPTVRKKTQDYKLAYFSLWWSRMVREGKKEEEEGLSNERMRRMSSLMLARRSENDCDDVPLSESGGEEMAENGCASMISTDVQIVPVGDDNIRYSHYYTAVRELDNSIIRGEDIRTIFGGGGEVLTENVQVINGGTQDQNQQTQ